MTHPVKRCRFRSRANQARRAPACDRPATPGSDRCPEHHWQRETRALWPLPLPDHIPDKPADGWQQRAACHGMDTELFYQDWYVPAEVIQACSTCPVRLDCLAAGLQQPAAGDHGIWGGTSPGKRRQIRRMRRRQRERLEAAA